MVIGRNTVICVNDFPYCVLEDTATEDEIFDFQSRLQKDLDKEDKVLEPYQRVRFVHWHVCNRVRPEK